MDLNLLLQRHQVSLFRADNAACEDSRRANRGLADGYAAAIAAFKRGLDVPVLA
jgi:hypothetical protein